MRPERLAQILGLERLAHPDASGDGTIELRGKQIFILPTQAGLLFGLVLFAMLMGSLNYANNMGFSLTFLLASVVIVSILHTYRNLVGLQIQPGRGQECFAGSPLRLPLWLDSLSSLSRSSLVLQADEGSATEVDLGPDGRARVTLEFCPAVRGWYRPGTVTISTRYPLGLFRAWARVDLDVLYLVFPQPSSEQQPLPGVPYGARDGGSAYGAGCEDFGGLYPYQPGHSLGHVHWKAVAQEQGLLTKWFTGSKAEEVWLEWDALAGLSPEERIGCLCRWVLEASKQGRAFGLKLPDGEIPIASGRWQRQA